MEPSRLMLLLLVGVCSVHLPLVSGPSGAAAEYTWNGQDWVWNEDVSSANG